MVNHLLGGSRLRGSSLGNSVQADAKFLRRIFLGLVLLTLAAGGMVGFTTAQAMTDGSPVTAAN
jgi:hypothetical protein